MNDASNSAEDNNFSGSRLENLLSGISMFCGWLLVVITVLQFGIVLARYLFAVNYLWLQELALYGHAALFMLASAWTLMRDRHVRIDVFSERWRDDRRRRVDRIGILVLLIPMMLVIGVSSFSYVAQSWSVLEGSAEISGLPGLFMMKSLIPVFALLMLVAGLLRWVRR